MESKELTDELARFEAVMCEKHPEWAFTPDPIFDYHNERTRCAWEGWQARAAVSAQVPQVLAALAAEVAHAAANDLRLRPNLGRLQGDLAIRASTIEAVIQRFSEAQDVREVVVPRLTEDEIKKSRYKYHARCIDGEALQRACLAAASKATGVAMKLGD